MTKQKMDLSQKKCITPIFRVSFPAVFKARAFENQEAKYGITMLFDNDTDLKGMRRCMIAAAKETWGDKENWPKTMRKPFRDGNEKNDLEGYKNKIYVTASAKTKPGLVDENLEDVIDESVFYAGCYARAEVCAFTYDTKGNKGVSFALFNLQKVKDGKPFSGKKAAKDVFNDGQEFSGGEDDEDDLTVEDDEDDL